MVERVTDEYLSTVEDDLNIWRHQVWIDNPAYSKVDAKGYAAIRRPVGGRRGRVRDRGTGSSTDANASPRPRR